MVKFLDPDPEKRKESLEALWDAWERLKTLGGHDKREHIKALLDQASGPSSPKFREAVEREARELTCLGNSLHIRHSETSQEPLNESAPRRLSVSPPFQSHSIHPSPKRQPSELDMKLCKKLIEVALPLDAINQAASREKSIRHGHPSTLHLWWARRPLAAARAVIFAQMVDDPSARPDLFPMEADQQRERERLFHLLEEMVRWENTTNEKVLEQAREEIRESWRRCCADNTGHPHAGELFDPDRLPAFHDPFAGGGALPLEAQRLGLEAHASDLNPVAVLINKAMIEIPPRFAGRAPVKSGRASGRTLKRRVVGRARMEGSAGAGGGRPLLRPVDA